MVDKQERIIAECFQTGRVGLDCDECEAHPVNGGECCYGTGHEYNHEDCNECAYEGDCTQVTHGKTRGKKKRKIIRRSRRVMRDDEDLDEDEEPEELIQLPSRRRRRKASVHRTPEEEFLEEDEEEEVPASLPPSSRW